MRRSRGAFVALILWATCRRAATAGSADLDRSPWIAPQASASAALRPAKSGPADAR
jgi:hypothetical protein